jgi:transketolase
MTNNDGINYTDSRDAIFQELGKIARNDSNVIVLSCDTPAQIFKQLQKELPKQFYNVGIAEQNAMSVAAGLALAGKKPFVYGITNFVTLRCLEQIRNDICGMNLPVTIIGSGTGLSYSSDGLTHHITEDIAVMRCMPNMQIFSPSDYNLLGSLIHVAYRSKGPCYIRFDKGPFSQKYLFNSDNDVVLGIYPGFPPKSIYIVTCGIMTDVAFKVRELLSQENPRIFIGVIDVFQLKPFGDESFSSFLKQYASYILTLEEHNVIGGLGSIVREFVAQEELEIPVEVLGIRDKFVYEVGDREYLRKLYGIDADSVLECIHRL